MEKKLVKLLPSKDTNDVEGLASVLSKVSI